MENTITNIEAFNALTAKKQEELRSVYASHPLVDYIDWDEYYDSPNGNALDFVKCVDSYTDEENRLVFVLEELVDDDEDYYLIFVCEDNAFYKVPSTAFAS